MVTVRKGGSSEPPEPPWLHPCIQMDARMTRGADGLEARVMITNQLQWDGKVSPPGRAVKKNKVTPPLPSTINCPD